MTGRDATWLDAADAASLLRSGATPAEAWRASYDVGVAPDGAPLVPLDLPEAEALRAAGRLSRRTGAPLAAILDTVVDCERSRERARLAREVALAGPRASATMLRWLPIAGWALAGAIDARAAFLLVATPLGWLLLGVGGALWFAGTRWIARLTARAARAGGDEDAALPLALAEAALAAGLDIPTAIEAVGRALGGPLAEALPAVSARLRAGGGWERAWGRVAGAEAQIRDALGASWLAGSAPVPRLRAAREAVVDRARADTERAAAELGVRVALPLSLCLLPSFVVVGIVPLLIAVGRGIGLGSPP